MALTISNRFSQHKELYNEIACFDPNRFEEVTTRPEIINLTTIAKALPEVGTISLKEEIALLSVASNYHQLKQGLFPGNDENLTDLSDYSDDEEDPTKVRVKEAACKNCLSCAFRLLSQYKLCSTAYENLLFLAYKYLVTLSVAQCLCERSFSKLKLVKTMLRSSLTQENLESLIIIPIEKDLALELKDNKEEIIDKFAASSKELSSLLLL